MDLAQYRADFPIFKRNVHGKPLIYLDTAATAQKPKVVIDTIVQFYTQHNANVHRGVYALGGEATALFEDAHIKAAKLVNCGQEEMIFTSGTTHAMNLLAYGLGASLKPGDEIVLTQLEHHSNLVPWQQLAQRAKIKLKFISITPHGELDLAAAEQLITERTKIVAATHISNTLGTIVPVSKLAKLAHARNAVLVIDGAQSVPHMPIDVKSLKADFLAFSGHKLYGPTGTGGLYGRRELLEQLPPFITGGDMIKEVQWEQSTWNDLPWKFEAGTPNIAGAVGLGAAIEYLQGIGMEQIAKHEEQLAQQAIDGMKGHSGVTVYGPKQRAGIVSFNITGVHAHDVAAIMDRAAICIRGGHHCCMPLHNLLGIAASARASFGLYNTAAEVDALLTEIETVKKIFKVR